MRIINRILAVAAVAVLTASCGDVVRSSQAPVFLVIDTLQGSSSPSSTLESTISSDVITFVTTGGNCSKDNPCLTYYSDPGSVTMRLVPKDIGPVGVPTAPSSNNEVTITRVHVQYRRADGRNTQGVDVPYAFDGATTGTIPATGTATLGFMLVRNVAKIEPPLVQLASNRDIITTIADVTFYGQDRVGNDVSVTGSIQIDFGNFGDK
jgi:hypothetical protein